MTFGSRKFLGLLGAATVVIVAEYVLVLSDCVISGRVLGEVSLGAMNLLMPVFSTVSFFTWLLAVGTSIVYSDAMGRASRRLASSLAGQGLAAAVALGVLLAAATFFLGRPYLRFMAPDGATTAFAAQYWRWYPLVAFLESLDMVLLYLVYTDGGERTCLVSYVGQVAVNVSASYLLCARTSLGMSGISLGTVLAYAVGIGALLPRLLSRACGIRFRLVWLPGHLLKSLKTSFGDASAGLFHALLFFVVTKYVLIRWGSEALPMTAVAFCIVRLTVFFNGVGIALQPLETVYHGEGNATAVARLVRFAAVVSVAEGLSLTAAVFAWPELAAKLMGIADLELVAATSRAVRLTVLGLSGYALAYMLNSHYQYVGRPGVSVQLTLLAFFAVPVALMFALGAAIGLDGVWIAVAAGPACAVMPFLPFALARGRDPAAPVVWQVDLSAPPLLASWEKRLPGGRDGPCARALAADMWTAVGQLARANAAAGRRARAEVSLLRVEGGFRAILRDDGVHEPVSGVSAETLHSPVTGFNRNILTWRNLV